MPRPLLRDCDANEQHRPMCKAQSSPKRVQKKRASDAELDHNHAQPHTSLETLTSVEFAKRSNEDEPRAELTY